MLLFVVCIPVSIAVSIPVSNLVNTPASTPGNTIVSTPVKTLVSTLVNIVMSYPPMAPESPRSFRLHTAYWQKSLNARGHHFIAFLFKDLLSDKIINFV